MAAMETLTYSGVRKLLDQRGYRQPLDASSLPLVDALLTDLVRATDQLSAYVGHASSVDGHQHRQGGIQHALTSVMHHHDSAGVVHHKAGFGVNSRAEHSRVVKENQELRQKITKLKEEFDRERKSLKMRLRKLESGQADSGLEHKERQNGRQLERETKQKSDKHDEITGIKQNNDATIQRNGEENIETSSDVYELGLIQFAEERINQLEADLIEAKAAKNDLLDELNDLKAQFDEKCDEVDRLQNFIDMPRRCDGVDFPRHDHHHGHLNLDFCHLHQNNLHLEKKLKEALNACQEEQAKCADLTNRNALLAAELKDVDRVSQALRKQKEELVSTADREMSVAKQELERLYKTVLTLETELSHLRQAKLQDEREQPDSGRSSPQLIAAVKALQREIKELQDKVQRASLREQELQVKLLQLEAAKLNGSSNVSDVGNLQQVVASLEKQRDYYKNRLEQLKERTMALGVTSTPIAPFDGRHLNMDEPLIQLLEEERDFYKNECLKLKGADGRSDGSTESPNNGRVVELERQLRSVIDEKDELRKTLEHLECVIEETNNSLREITVDRDRLRAALKQAEANLKAMKNLDSQGNFPAASYGSFSNFYEMQEERNKAKIDLEQALTELTDTRCRLKLATQTQITERTRMEKMIAELKSKLVLENGERAELLTKISSQKVLLDSMEERVQEMQNHMMNAEEKIHRARTDADQSKKLTEQTEKALKEAHRLLSEKASDRGQVEQMTLEFESRIEQLNQVIVKQKDDLLALQRSVVALDRDKDVLQMEVDNKAENAAALQHELLTKSNDLADLKTMISNLESRIDRLLEELHTKDMNVKAIQRQLDTANREARSTTREYKDTLDRNRQLKEDLIVMTRENQTVCEDLKKTKDDRDNLRAQLQNYVAEVSRVEELLESKDRERNDLLEQFHSLTSATSNLEMHNSVLEGQASSVRLELLSKNSELSHAKQSLETLNREIEEYFRRQQENESDIMELRRNLNDSDSRCFAIERERERLERDLAAMRDLCARLDTNKEKLVEEMSNKDSALEKIEMSAAELQLEREHLKSQLASQQALVESLEELLASNRQQSYHTQLENRKLTAEISALKNRLSDVENKLEEQSRIAARNRNRVSDSEDQIENLQRKLTSERFERERLNQELKRFQKSMSPTVGNVTVVEDLAGFDRQETSATAGGRKVATSLRTEMVETARRSTSTTSAEPPYGNNFRTLASVMDRPKPGASTSEQRTTAASTSSSSTSPNNNNNNRQLDL